jgi:biopolymer transport protein ExbD
MTAVFSRVTILQLDLPSANEAVAAAPPAFRLEVIVRESGFELTNGESLIAALPKVDGEYGWATLAQLAQQLKSENPEVNDASVLLERTVQYDYLIQVMDAIRSAELPADGGSAADHPGVSKRTELFTNIAVGEAP